MTPPATKIRRILVPVDFSKPSIEALDYATDLGKRVDAEIIVLYVVEPLYHAGDLGLLLEDEQRIGREELSNVEVRVKKRGLTCRTFVQIGTPYRIIADTAQRLRADLIVVGTHGRTGVSHLFMGSVAEKVVRTAPCPVLTVRPRGVRKTRRSAGRRFTQPKRHDI